MPRLFLTTAAAALLLAACAAPTPAADPATATAQPPAATATVPAPEPTQEPTMTPIPFELTSLGFENEAVIPDIYSCKGDDTSPELNWGVPPTGTESLALIFDDPDAPGGTWVHWIVYNLPGELNGMPPDYVPQTGAPVPGALGVNSWGRAEYGGPCPPQGSTHRYVFTVYALDTTLSFDAPPTKAALLAAMEGHILDQSVLYGTFTR